MEVGVGPGHIVLDGDPVFLRKKRTEPPIFGPSLLWPNGWMHQDATWYMEVGLGPGDFVLDGDPPLLPKKEAEPRGGAQGGVQGRAQGGAQGGAPNFRLMSIVAKWLDGSRWHLS